MKVTFREADESFPSCIFIWSPVLKYFIQAPLSNHLERNREEKLLMTPKRQQTGNSLFSKHI